MVEPLPYTCVTIRSVDLEIKEGYIMKRIIAIFNIILIASSLFASPLAKIYEVHDPLLISLQELSIASGINPQSSAGPLSGYEVQNHLEKINREKLSKVNQNLYDQVAATLSEGKSWGITISLAQEVYLNTNSDYASYNWAEGYNVRLPLLYGEVNSVFGAHAYGIFSYAIQDGFREDDFQGFSTNNPWILTGKSLASSVQNSVPHTAFIGVSTRWYSLIFGRDTIAYGRGNTGNLMLGDQAPYHDFLQLSLNNKKVKYSFLALPMNELVTGYLKSQGHDGELGEATYPHHNNSAGPWHTLFHDSRSRIYFSHRIEIDILPSLRVALTEGTLFYTSRADLRMFNPFMFLHNLQNFGEVNNSMGLEVECTLAPSWFLNAQFMLDQWQTAGEQDTSGNIPPNAYGGLLGVSYQAQKNNWNITGYLEGVYTSPYLYLRAGDNTHNYDPTNENTEYNLDFVHAVSMADGKSGVSWLGYTYGPDSIVLATAISLAHVHNFSVSGSMRFIAQGEKGLKIEEGKTQQVDLLPATEINTPSPSGENPEYSFIIGLGGAVQIPGTRLQVYGRYYRSNRWTPAYTGDNQVIIGASYALHF